MTKIGLLLVQDPQSVTTQSHDALIALLISHLINEKQREIVIAIPVWYKQNWINFLSAKGIDLSKVQFITTRNPSLLIKKYILKQHVTPNKMFLHTINGMKTFSTILSQCIVKILSLPLLPFLVLLPAFMWMTFIFMFVFFCTSIKWVLSKTIKFTKSELPGPIKTLIRKTAHFANSKLQFEFFRLEINYLINKINKRPDITTWYIPSLLWPNVKKINAKVIIAAPEISFTDCQNFLTQKTIKVTYESIQRTLKMADHLICYSDYAKQRQLINHFDVSPENISVIRNGSTDLSSYLGTVKDPDITRAKALKIIRDYQNIFLKHDRYLYDFDFTETRFLFYSARPSRYNNLFSLIKATEWLLRKKFLNIKLIITGNISTHTFIYDYCYSKKLLRDILFVPELPLNVLAAFNHLAICSVNPVLYDDAFPWTFAEAYSVGTPSVLSNIPMIKAEINDAGLVERMLFDPYDIKDFTSKLEWAILHREKLVQMQFPLYEQVRQWTWDDSLKEHVALFNLHS